MFIILSKVTRTSCLSPVHCLADSSCSVFIFITHWSLIDFSIWLLARKRIGAFFRFFPDCQMVPSGDVYLLFSLWHLARALQRLGSGHRSRGDCPFLLRMVKSAPLAARKHAIDAALFFSAPWVPRPMINCREAGMKRKKKHQRYIQSITLKSLIWKTAISTESLWKITTFSKLYMNFVR